MGTLRPVVVSRDDRQLPAKSRPSASPPNYLETGRSRIAPTDPGHTPASSRVLTFRPGARTSVAVRRALKTATRRVERRLELGGACAPASLLSELAQSLGAYRP
jgi:hypothetical protein